MRRLRQNLQKKGLTQSGYPLCGFRDKAPGQNLGEAAGALFAVSLLPLLSEGAEGFAGGIWGIFSKNRIAAISSHGPRSL